MSKINNPPGGQDPHKQINTPDDVKGAKKGGKGTSDDPFVVSGTLVAGVYVGQASAADALKQLLINTFGADIGNEAYQILVGKCAQGKYLNFKTVKEAVLEAAKKFNETIPDSVWGSFGQSVLVAELDQSIRDIFGDQMADAMLSYLKNMAQGDNLNLSDIESIIRDVAKEKNIAITDPDAWNKFEQASTDIGIIYSIIVPNSNPDPNAIKFDPLAFEKFDSKQIRTMMEILSDQDQQKLQEHFKEELKKAQKFEKKLEEKQEKKIDYWKKDII